MLLKLAARIIAALNSNVRKEQIAAAISSALLLALIPGGNLLWVALFIVFFLFKMHYGIQLLGIAFFKLFMPFTAPLLDSFGWYILNLKALQGLFIYMNSIPIAPLTRFNNSLVMGGLSAGLVLWLPVFFLARLLVQAYRDRLLPKIKSSRFHKAFFKIPLMAKLGSKVAAISSLGSK